jgi:cellulose synthase/poly-beta-1,6-N-acetylglucosamine synthase-like glycosyltransferase
VNDPAGAAPRVTVLMTVYNAQAHLRASIESLLGQSYRDFEFLIIDDGSTDNSAAIIKSYADARIRLIENSANAGQTRRLNEGLQLARGEFIARQDGDDVSAKHRLERQIAALDADAELGFVGTQAWIVDDTNRMRGAFYLPLSWEAARWARFVQNPFVHSSVIFRRSVVIEAGGYDESFRICQDYELWCRLIRQRRATNLSERLLFFRLSPNSLSQGARDVVREESRRIIVRELEHEFPQLRWSPEELGILCQFRFGLNSKTSSAFEQTFKKLHDAYTAKFPTTPLRKDVRRSLALQKIKLARDVMSCHPITSVRLLLQAAAMRPMSLLELIFSRLLMSKRAIR